LSFTLLSAGLEIFAHHIHKERGRQSVPTTTSSTDGGSFAKGVIIIPIIKGIGM
jgi:hypothetical protein